MTLKMATRASGAGKLRAFFWVDRSFLKQACTARPNDLYGSEAMRILLPTSQLVKCAVLVQQHGHF